jgi:hypothetical protein
MFEPFVETSMQNRVKPPLLVALRMTVEADAEQVANHGGDVDAQRLVFGDDLV